MAITYKVSVGPALPFPNLVIDVNHHKKSGLVDLELGEEGRHIAWLFKDAQPGQVAETLEVLAAHMRDLEAERVRLLDIKRGQVQKNAKR